MEKYFYELDLDFKGKTVFVDIDGTIAPLDGDIISKVDCKKMARLKEHNQVIICSNSTNQERKEKIAKQLEIEQYNKTGFKPITDFLKLFNVKYKKYVVIGDLAVTDGLFAKKINATFYKVKRIPPNKPNKVIDWILHLDDAFHKVTNKN